VKKLVVDASVAAKWFLPEEHSEAALRLLQEGRELLVPDLIWAEVGNTLWKRRQKNEVLEEDARRILQELGRFNLVVHSCRDLSDSAWMIASRWKRSFYDSLYLALSESESCPMVTADCRLFNSLSASWPSLRWVADIS
jgi:predicted nucleic acid-binding protein